MEETRLFNLVDLVIALGILLGMIQGVRRGLSGEIARLFSLLLSLVIWLNLLQPFSEWLVDSNTLEYKACIVGAVLLTAMTSLLAGVLASILLKRLITSIFSKTFDKVTGAFAGAVRAAAIAAILLVIVHLLPNWPLKACVTEESMTGRTIGVYVPTLQEKADETDLLKRIPKGLDVDPTRHIAKPKPNMKKPE